MAFVGAPSLVRSATSGPVIDVWPALVLSAPTDPVDGRWVGAGRPAIVFWSLLRWPVMAMLVTLGIIWFTTSHRTGHPVSDMISAAARYTAFSRSRVQPIMSCREDSDGRAAILTGTRLEDSSGRLHDNHHTNELAVRST